MGQYSCKNVKIINKIKKDEEEDAIADVFGDIRSERLGLRRTLAVGFANDCDDAWQSLLIIMVIMSSVKITVTIIMSDDVSTRRLRLHHRLQDRGCGRPQGNADAEIKGHLHGEAIAGIKDYMF